MAKKSIQLKDAVEGYIVRCRTKGYSDRTLEWYEQKLHCFCTYMLEQQGIKDLKAVTLFHIRAFVIYVQGIKSRKNKKISDLTVKGYVQVVKGFFSWCINEELLKDNPALKLERPKVGNYVISTFTQEEIKTLLAVCDLKTERGYRDYTIMLLLLDTGIRVSELC
jgi:site-specific recombinase XerD